MKLTQSQEVILRNYAKECHPKITKNPDDWEFLTTNRFIQPQQDHITDKGLAYCVAEMDMSFTKYMRLHKWQDRLSVFINFAKRAFHSDAELDIYFKAKYATNLKYETWGPNGQEYQLPPERLRTFTAEMFIGLLDDPRVDWKKVKRLFETQDPTGTFKDISSKEYFKSLLQEYLTPSA